MNMIDQLMDSFYSNEKIKTMRYLEFLYYCYTKFEKEIFYWREKYAKERNIPPSFICSDKNLKLLLKRIKNKTDDKIFLNKETI